MAEVTIPLGKGKGSKPVSQCDDAQLMQFIGWFDGAGGKPEKYAAQAAAARKELELRAGGGAQQPAAQEPKKQPPRQQRREPAPTREETALAKAPPAAALALAHDANAINQRFAALREQYHLVSPATHVDALPEGFGVSVAFVAVDPSVEKDGPGDVYKVGNKVGLSGHIIQQIGAASAIDWDANMSRRLDDGSDPHYVHYRAVGWAKNYDGTPRQIIGEVEIDARDGGPLEQEIREKARKRAERYPNDYNDGGDAQLLELRKFILRHAETKAQNRAICRGLGVKRAYTPRELKKPFAIARLSFTGYSEDPELRRRFAEMNAAAALQGSRALYGGAPPPAALPAAPQGHPPPELTPQDAALDPEDMADLTGAGDAVEGEFDDEPDPDPGNEAGEDTTPMRQPGED